MALAAGRSAGCRHKAKTPAEAYKRASRGGDATRDGGALFDALDQETRWNWMTIQKFHREAYDIVLSNYPEGEAASARRAASRRPRPRLGARSVHHATPRRDLPMLRAAGRCRARRSRRAPAEDTAAAVLASGMRVELKRSGNGDWGYAGLGKQAEEDKNRAYHDLEVVRASAADFERAAARAGK